MDGWEDGEVGGWEDVEVGGGRGRWAGGRRAPHVLGATEALTAMLSGGANTSPRRRILFYFSFKAAGERAPPGSMLRALRGTRTLDELSAELSGVVPGA